MPKATEAKHAEQHQLEGHGGQVRHAYRAELRRDPQGELHEQQQRNVQNLLNIRYLRGPLAQEPGVRRSLNGLYTSIAFVTVPLAVHQIARTPACRPVGPNGPSR